MPSYRFLSIIYPLASSYFKVEPPQSIRYLLILRKHIFSFKRSNHFPKNQYTFF